MLGRDSSAHADADPPDRARHIGGLLGNVHVPGAPASAEQHPRRTRRGLTLMEGGCHIPEMNAIRTLCVYCGSSLGTDPAFADAAQKLGMLLARNNIGLIYGGGSLGLMGTLASSVLDHGGRVTGIIPEFLTGKEQVMTRAQEVVVTHDMHERKRIMFERADAFAALPGGIGTLEELVEQLTWAQLGRHHKPIIILNIKRFWDPLLALLDHMRVLGFIRSELAVEVVVVNRVEHVVPKVTSLLRSRPPADEAASPIKRM